MARLEFAGNDVERRWRIRFGEPPPLRGSSELTRGVLAAFEHAPSARLSVEALALEREAKRARAELAAAREASRRLMAEARRILSGAGATTAGG